MMDDRHINKNEDFEFSAEEASETLKNVFEACEQPQNKIPFEILENKYRNYLWYDRIVTGFCGVAIIILVVALIAFGVGHQRNEKVDENVTVTQVEKVRSPQIQDVLLEESQYVLEIIPGTYEIDYDETRATCQNTGAEMDVSWEAIGGKLYIPFNRENNILDVFITDTEGNVYKFTIEYEE